MRHHVVIIFNDVNAIFCMTASYPSMACNATSLMRRKSRPIDQIIPF